MSDDKRGKWKYPIRKETTMKVQTEIAIRGILQMDAEVVKADMDRAINILNGRHDEDDDLVHVIRRKDAMKWLGVHRRTLDYYLKMGYLDRVYGGGKRALGISRESYIRFTTHRPAPLIRETRQRKRS